MTSSASMIGMPASTKTLSWREKCMISLRLTVLLVISNCRMLLCSLTSSGLQAALEKGKVRGGRRRGLLGALDGLPLSSVAVVAVVQ